MRHRLWTFVLAALFFAVGGWCQEAPETATQQPDQAALPSSQPNSEGVVQPSGEGVPAVGGPPAAAATAEAAPLETEATLEEELASVKELLEEARGRLVEAEAQQPPPPDMDTLRGRADRLESLKNLFQRRITLRGRYDEVVQSLEEFEKQEADYTEKGLSSEPPYALSFYDTLRDDRAALEREYDTVALSVKSLGEALKRAETELANAQKARRAAREAAESGDAKAMEAFKLALLDERLAEQRLEAARTQVEVAEKRESLTKRRVELAREMERRVVDEVEFLEENLNERLEDIAQRRATLEKDLDKLKRTRDANESKLFEARQELQAAPDESKQRLELALTARDAWLQASNRGVEYAEERLANLMTEETVWRRRFDLLNETPDIDLFAWKQETAATLEDVRSDIEMVEARLNDMRSSQLELANRLEVNEVDSASAEQIKSRLKALESREQYARDYLASLVNLERLASRLASQLEDAGAAMTLMDRWELVRDRVYAVWNYELLVYLERPITVAGITKAVVVFLAVVLFAWIVRWLLKRTLIRRLTRGDADEREHAVRDTILVLVRQTKSSAIFIFALYAALHTLPLGWRPLGEDAEATTFANIANHVAMFTLWAQIAIWMAAVLTRTLERSRRRRAVEDPSSVSAYGLLSFFGRVAIWAIAFMTALSLLGHNITTLIATLGVGGIAIAFALQSILADIFNSVAIVLDKPFAVGDFIITGDTLGTVEQIGIKTTRVRSLGGEQIIVSNTDLLGSRISNYKRMFERRIVFGIGVVYETPLEKLQRIPEMVRSIIEATPKTRFDRAHFARYGDFSLDFEFVYYVEAPDYYTYMDTQQQINYEIFRQFAETGISFAYPTREIVLRPNKGTAQNPFPPDAGPEVPDTGAAETGGE